MSGNKGAMVNAEAPLRGGNKKNIFPLTNSKVERRKGEMRKINHSTSSKLIFSRTDDKQMNVVVSFTL